ncbi:MAG: hypothetical protein ACKPKO_05385, partial [Candidatus Fonsibacter sp.]
MVDLRSCTLDFYAPNIYNKSDIDNKLSGKLNTTGDILISGHISTTNGNANVATGTVGGKYGSFFQNFTVTRWVELTKSTTNSRYIFMGHDTETSNWGIEVCASAIQYIDFTSPGI